MICGSLCSFQSAVNLSIMNVAFPDLQASFSDQPRSTLSWVLNTYTIVAAAILIPLGVLADRVGRKRVLMVGLAAFTLGSTMGALAPSIPVLIVARVLQAIGGSAITPASVALILNEVPASRRTTAIAVWGGIGSAAAALGPSLGSVIVDAGGWRWAFWVSVPLGVSAIAMGIPVFRESRDPDAREMPDLAGAILLMAGTGGVTLGLVQSPRWDWLSVRTLGSIVIGLGLLAALVWRSSRVSNPMLDLSLFRYPTVRRSALGSTVFGIGFFAMFFGAVQFLRFAWDYPITKAGLLFTPVSVTIACVSAFAGRGAERFGHRRMIAIGGSVFSAGAIWLTAMLSDEPDLRVWLTGIVAMGLGSGLAWPAIHGLSVVGIPMQMFAAATSVNQTFQRVSTVLGVAITISLTESWTTGDGVGAYRGAFGLMAGAGIAVVAVGSLRAPPTSPRGDSFATLR